MQHCKLVLKKYVRAVMRERLVDNVSTAGLLLFLPALISVCSYSLVYLKVTC
jgi:hypothetical protein